MEKEYLSKNKRIFVITNDGVSLHAQKFPVIYINKKYVYYRVNGDDCLQVVELRNVSDKLDVSDLAFMTRYTKKFTWSIPDGFEENNRMYVKQAKRKSLEIAIKRVSKNIESYNRSIDENTERLRELEKSLAALDSKD